MASKFCKSFATTLLLQSAFNSVAVLGLWKIDALKGISLGEVLLVAIGMAAFCAMLSGVATITTSYLSKATD